MMLAGGDDRRCSMAVVVQHMHPTAHWPLVLGVLQRLEVATVIDRRIPPHPAHGLSGGRGVAALGARCWTDIRSSTRSGDGSKSGGWWRCCSRGSHVPHAMM